MYVRRAHGKVRKLTALTAAVVLTATSFAHATPALAADNTLGINPATVPTSVGSTFSVDVVGSTELQIVGIAQGPDWVAGGASFLGYPAAASTPAFLAQANATGTVPRIAAFFVSGSLAAGDHKLLSITFEAIACGDSAIELPEADGAMIDGEPATLGDDLTVGHRRSDLEELRAVASRLRHRLGRIMADPVRIGPGDRASD